MINSKYQSDGKTNNRHYLLLSIIWFCWIEVYNEFILITYTIIGAFQPRYPFLPYRKTLGNFFCLCFIILWLCNFTLYWFVDLKTSQQACRLLRASLINIP